MSDLDRAFALEARACAKWGGQAQAFMACEEAAEFSVAVCQYGRGRATAAEVIDEAADVIIMATAMAYLVGQDLPPAYDALAALKAAIERKLDRLEDRLDGRADYNGKPAVAIEGGAGRGD